MDMAFLAERRHFFQAPIELARPFPAPELRTKHFTDMRIFSEFSDDSLENGHFPFVAWEKSHVAGGRKSGPTN